DFPRALRAVKDLSGEEKVFIVGHSLGGAVSYAAAPTLASSIRGIVTLGGVFYWGRGIPVIRALGSLGLRLFKERLPLGFPIHTGIVARALLPRLSYLEPLLDTMRLLPWEPGSLERPLLQTYLQWAFDRTSVAILDEMLEWMTRGCFGKE